VLTNWASDAGLTRSKLRDQVELAIRCQFDDANVIIQEAPTTEYLFLLGYEDEDKIRTLQWHYLIFNAGNGHEGARFHAN
jgi:hypothetical protein